MVVKINKPKGTDIKDAVDVTKRFLRNDEDAVIIIICPSNQGRYAGVIRYARNHRPRVSIEYASTVSNDQAIKKTAATIINTVNNGKWYHSYP